MLPRLRNSNETRPTPLGNAPPRVARLAQAGRWLWDRMAKRNSYIGRLKAAVYADMVGYSRLFRLDDAGTVARLRNMHRMLRPALRLYHGRRVQTGGDSMLITFDSLTEAVRCAVTMQYALALENDGSWRFGFRRCVRQVGSAYRQRSTTGAAIV
jgi:class 3 adenylate cyclase